jgi:dTMP kinase
MRWIVVDGIDGSGKSTYAGFIQRYYQDRGENVMVHIHPSSGWPGRISRKALESRGMTMQAVAAGFFIADIIRSLAVLKKEARHYDTVIFVRYVLAAAYLPDRLTRSGYRFISKLLPLPERLILIDVDPAIANERISNRDQKKEMFEDPANLRRAWERLLSLASGEWRIIDNNRTIDEGRESLFSLLKSWDGADS